MERFIADLVKRFETGNISRRDFCEGVALAAAVYAAGGASANAQPAQRPQDAGRQSHLLYLPRLPQGARFLQLACSGMEKLKDDGKARVNLAFGPAPGKGGSFIVARNAAPIRRSRRGQWSITSATRFPTGTMRSVNAALKAKGQNPTGRRRQRERLRPVQFPGPARFLGSGKPIHLRRGRTAMEGFVATKLNEFEQGKISRRTLIETLTLAVTTAARRRSARPPRPAGVKAALVNHVSYTCPEFQAGRRLVFESLQPRSGRAQAKPR